MTGEKRPSVCGDDAYEALRRDGASEEKAARIAQAQADLDRTPSAKGGAQPPHEG